MLFYLFSRTNLENSKASLIKPALSPSENTCKHITLICTFIEGHHTFLFIIIVKLEYGWNIKDPNSLFSGILSQCTCLQNWAIIQTKLIQSKNLWGFLCFDNTLILYLLEVEHHRLTKFKAKWKEMLNKYWRCNITLWFVFSCWMIFCHVASS